MLKKMTPSLVQQGEKAFMLLSGSPTAYYFSLVVTFQYNCPTEREPRDSRMVSAMAGYPERLHIFFLTPLLSYQPGSAISHKSH
jgi:hypothetical protein